MGEDFPPVLWSRSGSGSTEILELLPGAAGQLDRRRKPTRSCQGQRVGSRYMR